MKETAAPARRRGVLYWFPLILMIPLSLVTALYGLVAGAMFTLCYDQGPSIDANRCFAVGLFLAVACVATLLAPVIFGIWGARATTRGEVVARLGVCLLGYLVPLLFFVASTIL
jgi:hypothetical protein